MDGFAADIDQLLACRDRLAGLHTDATTIATLAEDADPDWYIWGLVGTPMAQIYWDFATDIHSHLELLAASLHDRVTSMDLTVQQYEAADRAIAARLERAARGDSDVTNDPVAGGVVEFSPSGVDVVRFDPGGDIPLVSTAVGGYESAVDGDIGGIGGAAIALGAHAVAVYGNPLNWLISAGLGFLVDLVQPIEDLLGLVTGNPERMTGEIEKWHRVSGALGPLAEEIRAAADSGLAGWEGLAADTARARLHDFADGVAGLAGDVDRLAALMDIARTLMDLIQQILIGLLAQLVEWFIITWSAAISASVVTAGASTAAAGAATTAQVSVTTTRAVQFVDRVVLILQRLGRIVQKMAPVRVRMELSTFRTRETHDVIEAGAAMREVITDWRSYVPSVAEIGGSTWRGLEHRSGGGMSDEQIEESLDPDR